MPVYDFSSGFAGLNSGIKSLGDSLKAADQQAYLQALLQKANAGDWPGASTIAAQRGDLDTWTKIKKLQSQSGPAPTMDDLGASGGPAASPPASAPASPASPPASPTDGQDPTAPRTIDTPTGSLNLDAAKVAIKGNESAGSGGYSALGPVQTDGDRAIGAYQIMGKNVGPWTKEVLGTPMTAQQFLSSPEAQDRVFEAKFGGAAQKYGHLGAANWWFSGSPSPDPDSQDNLGTSVRDYGNGFLRKYVAAGKATAPGPAPAALPQPGYLTAEQRAALAAQVTPDAQRIIAAQRPTQMAGDPLGTAGASGPRSNGPAPAAIAFAKYGGKSFTREDAVRQDGLEAKAGDDDTVPDAPNTEEWDAAARAEGGVQPMAPAATAPSASSTAQTPRADPQLQAAAKGFVARLDALGPPGTPARMQMLQNGVIVAQQRALNNPAWKPIGDALAAQLKSEAEGSVPTSSMKEYQYYAAQERAAGRTPDSFKYWKDKSSDPTTYAPITEEQTKFFPGAVAVDSHGKPLYPPQSSQPR